MRTTLLLTTALLLGAVAAGAQTPESLSGWLRVRDVQVQAPVPLAEIRLDAPALSGARDDLADVRLYDSSSREVPYALRILRDLDESDELEAREFNRSTDGARALVSIDLGADPNPHNEIEVDSAGKNFRRRVAVLGSDDGQSWATLVEDAFILRFASGGSEVEVQRVSYPDSRFRYLRIALEADPASTRTAPAVRAVRVRQTLNADGEEQDYFLQSVVREATRDQGRPASAYRIDLNGRAPLHALRFTTAEADFSRPFRLESTAGEHSAHIASGTLSPAEGTSEVTLRFDEAFASELTLTIIDDRNPPLQIYSVVAVSAVRQLLFDASAVSGPLRLYYGNMSAAAPFYDFADRLDRRPTPQATFFLEPERKNPDYRAPEKPFTERAPWAVYLVLAAACLGLFAVLRNLVKAADTAEESETEPPAES